MKRFLIIDAHSLIHRAYHALPPLASPKGEPTGAVYGFTSMTLKALKDLRPDCVVAAFDLPEPTFRHKQFQGYKSTRPPMPADLVRQIEKVKEVLAALGITALGAPGFEADDIIGTLSSAAKNDPALEVIILSGDLDTLQLAGERVKISMPKRGISDITDYDSRAVKERYGFGPELLVDYKALRGDPSDNVPGVPGIGEKTATALVIKFGNIENLYRELETGHWNEPPAGGEAHPGWPFTPAVRKKLIAGKEMAFLSKAIVTINTAAPVKTTPETYAFAGPALHQAETLFAELGFKTLLSRLENMR